MRDTIFICYRRSDSRGNAGRLEDSLRGFFGKERVFRDVGGIKPGEDFKDKIDTSIEGAGALIVLIGPNWMVNNAAGKPRLHDPDDHVASEIEAALLRELPVFPVLVDGATLPREEDLPEALKPLARRNAVTLNDERWGFDVTRLAKVLAFDIAGSVVERKLHRLKLLIVSLLLVSSVITTVSFAWGALNAAQTSVPAAAVQSAAQANEKTQVEDKTRLSPFGPGMGGLNYPFIIVASLLLTVGRLWVAPQRRTYLTAAILLGMLSTLGVFVFYCVCNEQFGLLSLAVVFTASNIIITGMLLLMTLSGFTPNDSVE